jgi:uncharacterized lipoprotein YajG
MQQALAHLAEITRQMRQTVEKSTVCYNTVEKLVLEVAQNLEKGDVREALDALYTVKGMVATLPADITALSSVVDAAIVEITRNHLGR